MSTAFVAIALKPFTHMDIACPILSLQERFTVFPYRKSNNVELVKARMELFCQDAITMEKIPPTFNALLQHARQAAYQARVWATSENMQ